MTDIQEIYTRLLARHFQDDLFSSLAGQQLAKGGRETTATCPFCGKAGHFSYSSEKPVWKCWHCQEAGDWIRYLEKTKGYTFQDALTWLANEAGVELYHWSQAEYKAYTRKADILERAQDILKQALQESAGQAVLQYLQTRGYSTEEIQSMELGAYVDRDGLERTLREAGYTEQEIKDSGLLTAGFGSDYTLTMLWRDPAGRAIGIVGRSILSEEQRRERGLVKYKYSVGLQKDKGLVGFSSIRGSPQIVLVEGVLDSLYLNHKGFKTVAIGGTSISPEQIHILEIAGTKEILLALDMDEPGRSATEKMLKNLSTSSLRSYVVSWPDEYKDPDELVRKAGPQAFQEALQRAERGSAWMTRRIISQHDLQTDRGLDKALEEASAFYASLEDKIEQRDVLQVLEASTGLSEDILSSRVREHALRASQKRARDILEATLRKAGDLASEGDTIGAEQVLVSGLQAMRSARGVVAPEPYLLQDLERDISTMSFGLLTDYKALDNLFRIPIGALSIVAGRPAHGKTSLLLNLMLKMAKRYQDKSFYFFSYEEAARPLAIKLIMIMAGEVLNETFNLEAYTSYLKDKRGTKSTIDKAISEYQELTSSGRLWLLDSRLTAEDLAATITYLARRGEIGAIFVDYIQKIPLQRPEQQNLRYLEIKKISELLLEQAVSHDISIILGAQLGRSAGNDSKVRLDNLRESGDIEQDANLVLGLYNEAVENTDTQAKAVPLQVTVLKNRVGPAGLYCYLTFDRATLKITDQEPW